MLGGTFDPPHLGHLAIAREALGQLGLRSVALLPARMPPHKPSRSEPGPQQRLQMCRLIARAAERLSVCPLELERDGPSYTVDTLRAIHDSHPEAELTFIAGADIARTLPTWREPAALLELARLAVAPRAGTNREAVLEAVAEVGDPARVCFLERPLVPISSSLVRERLAADAPVAELVGSDVAQYISEHRLYGEHRRGED